MVVMLSLVGCLIFGLAIYGIMKCRTQSLERKVLVVVNLVVLAAAILGTVFGAIQPFVRSSILMMTYVSLFNLYTYLLVFLYSARVDQKVNPEVCTPCEMPQTDKNDLAIYDYDI